MPKHPKKLALSSEIIRTLSSAELDAIAGGQDGTIGPAITPRPSVFQQCPSQPQTTCCPSEVPSACCPPSARVPC